MQGPLFVNGGEGDDRTGLLEREPVMLPGERNVTPPMGHVISSTPGTLDNTIAATVTIEHSQLADPVIGVSIETRHDDTVADDRRRRDQRQLHADYEGDATSAPRSTRRP